MLHPGSGHATASPCTEWSTLGTEEDSASSCLRTVTRWGRGSALSQTYQLCLTLHQLRVCPGFSECQWSDTWRARRNWSERMLSRMIREPCLSRGQQTWYMKPSISTNSTINIQCNKLYNIRYQTAESIWMIAIGVGTSEELISRNKLYNPQ